MNYSSQIRLYLITIFIIAGFYLLISRLWEIQISNNKNWINKMYTKSKINVRIPGVRGEIKDRNGIVLATNVASYEVVFNLEEMIEHYKSHIGSLPRLSKSRSKNSSFNKGIDIVSIVNSIISVKLKNLGLVNDYKEKHLSVHYKTHGGLVPFVYKRNLSFIEFSKFAEHSLELPGVHVRVKPSRKYVYGSLASHVIGYISLFDEQKIDRSEYDKYDHYVGDDYGKSGIEKSMNDVLTAKPGQRIIEKDEKGSIGLEKEYIKPKKGSDVYLTLDARIQYVTEKFLSYIGQGAAVVIDPNSGDILALASVPSYDPNVFIPNISKKDWDELRKDKNNPLINRALMSYAPGSTFKIATALSASYKFPNIEYNYPQQCNGVTYFGKTSMNCWIKTMYDGKHGNIYLVDAIKQSCNCFFYQISSEIGISTMKKVFTWLGLGQNTGIPLEGEKTGNVPDKIWFSINKPREKWSAARTAQVSIGQGSSEATPLQMALLSATIANSGNYYSPRLIHKIDDHTKDKNDKAKSIKPKLNLNDLGISLSSIKSIQKGMYKVVNEEKGTAKSASLLHKNIAVCGKTGTAQTGYKLPNGDNDTNAWFISYAPEENPKVAVAVFVKHAKSGGSVAAPISKKIIESTLSILNNDNNTNNIDFSNNDVDKEISEAVNKSLKLKYNHRTFGHNKYINKISFNENHEPQIEYLFAEEKSDIISPPGLIKKPFAKKIQIKDKPTSKPKAKKKPQINKKKVHKAKKYIKKKPKRRSFFDFFR